MISVLNPDKKYNLEYYMNVVEKIVNMGSHILGIKDSKPTRPFPSFTGSNDVLTYIPFTFSGWCAEAESCHAPHWHHPQEVP